MRKENFNNSLDDSEDWDQKVKKDNLSDVIGRDLFLTINEVADNQIPISHINKVEEANYTILIAAKNKPILVPEFEDYKIAFEALLTTYGANLTPGFIPKPFKCLITNLRFLIVHENEAEPRFFLGEDIKDVKKGILSRAIISVNTGGKIFKTFKLIITPTRKYKKYLGEICQALYDMSLPGAFDDELFENVIFELDYHKQEHFEYFLKKLKSKGLSGILKDL